MSDDIKEKINLNLKKKINKKKKKLTWTTRNEKSFDRRFGLAKVKRVQTLQMTNPA